MAFHFLYGLHAHSLFLSPSRVHCPHRLQSAQPPTHHAVPRRSADFSCLCRPSPITIPIPLRIPIREKLGRGEIEFGVRQSYLEMFGVVSSLKFLSIDRWIHRKGDRESSVWVDDEERWAGRRWKGRASQESEEDGEMGDIL